MSGPSPTHFRVVLRGLWRRRRHSLGAEARLSPRHLAVLTFVAGEEGLTVGEIAAGLALSLPAASRLTRNLEDAKLVRRRRESGWIRSRAPVEGARVRVRRVRRAP